MHKFHAPNQPTAMVVVVKRVRAVGDLGREREKRWRFFLDPDDSAHP
jgi:hypothetical protein